MAMEAATKVGNRSEEGGFSDTASHTEEPELCRRAFGTLRYTLLGDDHRPVKDASIESYISTSQFVTLTLGATGSFACNQWAPGDPIHVSVAGTPTESTFYSLARTKFRTNSSEIVIEKSDPADYVIFQLNIHSIRFNITYHQAPSENLAQLWRNQSVSSDLPIGTKKLYVDRAKTLALASIFGDSARNQECGLLLKSWAKHYGLYSGAFRLLHDSLVVDMAAATISALEAGQSDDWSKEQFFQTLPKLYDSRQATEVQQGTYKVPVLTRNTCTGTLVRNALKSLPHQMTSPEADPFSAFTQSYRTFLKVDLSYWGPSSIKRGRYIEAVENILAGYLKRLEIRLFPKLILHPWPARLVAKDSQELRQSSKAGDYEPTYLVGARRNGEVPEDVMSSIPTLLRAEIVRNKHYDMNHSYIDVCWTTGAELGVLVKDSEDLGALPEEKKPGDQEDEDDGDVEGSESLKSAPAVPKRPLLAISSQEAEDTPHTKLRPALDVLHRIKNDHALDSADYVVGYLDRHTGMKEMPAEWWILKEETAEDFIPQSRIRYFKRISDGITVWDRESRLDLVFGSGRKT